MRIRIKFSKQPPMQYIGHLDTMRYFQKVIRRSGVPAAFSEGFSPHILMSFASPLGVGKTSRGEYFDLDLEDRMSCAEIAERMQRQLTPGFGIRAVSEIDTAKKYNGMRVIAAASYEVSAAAPVPVSEERIREFMAQDAVVVLRSTKRKEEMTDIRPWIHALTWQDGRFSMLLSAGSVHNLKPELVLQAYAAFQHIPCENLHPAICRTELYALGEGEGGGLTPLLTHGCIDPTGVYRE